MAEGAGRRDRGGLACRTPNTRCPLIISWRLRRPPPTSRATTACATAIAPRACSDITDLYEKSRAEGFGAEVRRRILIGTYVLSAGYYDAYYARAQKLRTLIARDFTEAFKQCDVLLTPATPGPAFAFGEKTDDPVAMYLNDVFTVTVNLAGLARPRRCRRA